MSDPKLRNLGAAQGRNHFSNMPLEFVVPKNVPVVFVSDLSVTDYQGGAELTTDAIMKKAPCKTFFVHSQSLTVDMLDKYKDRHWVICNFTQCEASALSHLATGGFQYSVIEYDYKYCMFRSEVLHQKQTGQPCDCPLRPHGILVEKLYAGAQRIFWMSEAQKEHFLSRIPALIFGPPEQHVVLSSVFSDEALDTILGLREVHTDAVAKLPVKIWAVQGSQNWIKGTEDAVKWCAEQKMPVKVLGQQTYDKFLVDLAKSSGLVFRPLDFDTCPRIVIEAKLMGLDLELNDNVQHKNEPWFTGTVEDTVSYLRSRGAHFWSQLGY
jgi:hypothetical protein